MTKTVQIALAVAVVLAVGSTSYWLGTKKTAAPAVAAAKPGGPPPGTPVEAVKVATISLPQSLTAVGSLRSDESVVLRPEVSGRISEILFREGQIVRRDDVLVRFDSSVQRAELEQAKANLILGKSKFERAVDLQNKGFISSQARDEAENNYRVSQAAVELATARLSKLDLKAPFAGTVGLRLVSLGDYVKDGQDIANLEAIDALKVDFRVPEIYLKQVAVGQALQMTVDAFPNRTFEGKVLAINPLVDANGRSIVVRAQTRNTGELRPGMFVRVRLLIGDVQQSLVIPEQALVPSGDDLYVFKVVDNRALRVKVEIGQRRDAQVEILKGLDKDDVIVTAGQIKVRDGAPVKATQPETRPAAAPAPAKPGNAPPAKS